MNKLIKCVECKSVFCKTKHLDQHMRRYHGAPLKRKIMPKGALKCHLCPKYFSSKSCQNRHVRDKHRETLEKQVIPYRSRLYCPEDSCLENFPTYKHLRNHLKAKAIEVEAEHLEFNTMKEFEKWKTTIQHSQISNYILDTAPKVLSNNRKRSYYNCHRSYSYCPKGNNLRALKSTGTSKTGKACPSRIEVTEFSENGRTTSVKVTFWKTHVGHELELAHVILDKEARSEIAGRIKRGVSFDHILDTIKHANEMDNNQRLCLLNRKDLYNIVRDYNISLADLKQERCGGGDSESPNIQDGNAYEVVNLMELYQNSNTKSAKMKNLKAKANLLVDLCDRASLSEETCEVAEDCLDTVIHLLTEDTENSEVIEEIIIEEEEELEQSHEIKLDMLEPEENQLDMSEQNEEEHYHSTKPRIIKLEMESTEIRSKHLEYIKGNHNVEPEY